MKLETFLGQSFTGDAIKGASGVESPWLDIASVSLPIGSVHVVDSGCIGDRREGFVVDMAAGLYEAKAKAIVYGHEVRFSRVRLVKSGTEPVLGTKIGETGTDSGTIALYDLQSLTEAERRDSLFRETVVKALKDLGHNIELFQIAGWPESSLLVGSCGFGDGTFPVFALLDGPNYTGMEVVFIESSYPYPFSTKIYKAPREPDEDEKLHWTLIEALWDEGHAAFRKGPEETRQFFEKLPRGRRVALALRVLINYTELIPGGLLGLIVHIANPFLLNEIKAGLLLVGATDHLERLTAACSIYKDVLPIVDYRERLRASAKIRASADLAQLQVFKEWFIKSGKDPSSKLEGYIGRYARSHPEDF